MNNMHLLLMTSGILYKHAAKNVENEDCKSIAVGFLLIHQDKKLEQNRTCRY